MGADEAPLSDVDDRAELARRLGALRDRRGLSVRDVARASGLPLGTVGGYLSGRHLPQPATVDQFERMLAALGVEPDERAAWVDVVARLRRVPGPRPATARRPYRGLTPYDVADAALFVGRESVVRALVERVDARPPCPVVVLGASGAGKSSLLRAGLVAHARGAGRPAVLMTPGTAPLDALDAAEAQLADAAAGGDAGDAAHPVLVVDQLEEAIIAGGPAAGVPPATAGRHPAAATGLLRRLAALHDAGTTVVVALRADVLARALEDELLATWVGAGPVALGPMSAADLRRVVVEPARAVGADVDEALVDALIAEATAGSPRDPSATGDPGAALDPGVLPLVSHVLDATWHATTGRRLTAAAYRAVGGLGGAIAQSAEAAVASLPEERLAAVRRVLLALVRVQGPLVTAPAFDLADLDGAGEADVVAALVDARLLTVDGDRVRLAHEALLSAWPRLAAWIDDDREALRVHGRLAEATRHWLEAGQDADLLHRGTQLDLALAWQAEGRTMTAAEHRFLEASRVARDREAAAGRRSAVRLRVLAVGLAALALASVILAGVAVGQGRVAAHERDLAVSRQLAVTADALTATDPALAAQTAAAALAAADTVEARSALLSATGIAVPARLGDVGGLVNELAVSPDGSLVAAATDRSAVAVWDPGDAPRAVTDLPVDDAALYAVRITADGTTLLAAGDGGLLHAWSLSGAATPVALDVAQEPAGATLYDLAVSDDGRLVAGAASDGTVRLWTATADGFTASGLLTAVPEGSTQGVALDAAGVVLAAAGSSGVLTLWDVTDPTDPTRTGGIEVGGAQVTALDLAPDGSTVAAATTEGLVRLVDVSTPAAPSAGAVLDGPVSWVNDVAFSPDGSRVAGASSDRSVWVWDPATGAAAGRATTPTTLLTARWSPDGSALYLSGADGMLREWGYPGPVLADFASIPGQGAFAGASPEGAAVVVTATTGGLHVWDAADPARFRLLGTAPAPGEARLDGAVDVSPDLRLAVAGDTSGAIHVWDLSDPTAPTYLTSAHAHADWVDTVTFDATGRRLAVSSDDGDVTLWDLSDGRLPAEPTGRLTDLGGAVYVVAFSPDATTLVASVLPGHVQLVDVRDLAAPALLGEPVTGPTGYVYSTAFSPDGRTVAATGNDGTLWLWDASDPDGVVAVGAPLRWGEGYGTNTAFSPDGTRVAVGMTDGTVRVWDVSDPAAPVRWATLRGAGGTVYGVEFSPDGRYLSGASADRTVRVWDTTVEGALARACSTAARGLAMTDDEWTRLAADVPRPAACG